MAMGAVNNFLAMMLMGLEEGSEVGQGLQVSGMLLVTTKATSILPSSFERRRRQTV